MEVKLSVTLSQEEIRLAVESWLVVQGVKAKTIEFCDESRSKTVGLVAKVEGECQSLKK